MNKPLAHRLRREMRLAHAALGKIQAGADALQAESEQQCDRAARLAKELEVLDQRLGQLESATGEQARLLEQAVLDAWTELRPRLQAASGDRTGSEPGRGRARPAGGRGASSGVS